MFRVQGLGFEVFWEAQAYRFEVWREFWGAVLLSCLGIALAMIASGSVYTGAIRKARHPDSPSTSSASTELAKESQTLNPKP